MPLGQTSGWGICVRPLAASASAWGSRSCTPEPRYRVDCCSAAAVCRCGSLRRGATLTMACDVCCAVGPELCRNSFRGWGTGDVAGGQVWPHQMEPGRCSRWTHVPNACELLTSQALNYKALCKKLAQSLLSSLSHEPRSWPEGLAGLSRWYSCMSAPLSVCEVVLGYAQVCFGPCWSWI